MKILDIVIIAVIAAAVIFAFISVIRDRKSGKSCNGNCSECKYNKTKN